MIRNIDKVLSHGDEQLLEQFKAIDELQEYDVRTIAKKMCADFKEARIFCRKLEERKDMLIEELYRRVDELETRIETRDEKIRKLFDLEEDASG
jgi:hypothetical protein